MTTGPVEQALQQGATRLNHGLVFGADRDFMSTLTMGQIIKGRVLRHYEGGRYGVEFGGQERVVDSTIALRSGDIIHGRVVGLGDKVHLQRVALDAGQDPVSAKPAAEPGTPFMGRAADHIEQLFREHRANLSPAEHSMLGTLGRQLGDVSVAASAALVLRKLGLPLDSSMIRALTQAMTERGKLEQASVEKTATRLAADPTQRVAENHDAVRLLAQALEQLRVPDRAGLGDSPDRPADAEAGAAGASLTSGGDGRPGGDSQSGAFQQAWLLGRRILNSQTEGSVAHRFMTLPLWLGDRLLEVNLAFFAQTPSEHEAEGVSYRRIVLSLDLDDLGQVEVVVMASNRHLRIAFETEREEATQLMALWMGSLRSDLTSFGWEIDELSYGTRFADALDWPARSVVSHYVRQDSLSRLM